MARTTKCPHCKETTFSREGIVWTSEEDFIFARLCNNCNGVKPVRARTAKSQAKYDEMAARFAKYAPELCS